MYTNDGGIQRYIKMIVALPLLPHLEIPSFFQWFKVHVTTHTLQERVQYIDTKWINSIPFDQDPGTCTNNQFEQTMAWKDGIIPWTDTTASESIFYFTCCSSYVIKFAWSAPENCDAPSDIPVEIYRQGYWKFAVNKTTKKQPFQIVLVLSIWTNSQWSAY